MQGDLTAADISRLADGYASDKQFRTWLKAAARRSEKLRNAIEALSLRKITDIPSPSLRQAVDQYVRSRDVQLFHLHHEWMRAKGPFGGQPILVLTGQFYALWRAREDGGELPWELDPGKPCDERFEMHGERKGGGHQTGDGIRMRRSWRTYFSFGIARRTRQKIVDTALKAASCNQYRTQFIFSDGGRIEAIDEIVAAINADPSLTHFAKLDLANCFDHVDLTRAQEILPVRRKVIQNTIGINRQEAIDRRQSEHIRYDRMMRADSDFPLTSGLSDLHRGSEIDSFASRYPLTLPQGAATSPRVAYWLIERGLPPMNPDREFTYGDDLLILGQSKQEVDAQVSRFQELFWRHAAGPLQLSCVETGELISGADFLGVNISCAGRPNWTVGKRTPRTSVTVAHGRYERFVTKVHEKVDLDVACHDPWLTRTCRYVRAFLNNFPTRDHRALVRCASEIARAAGANPDAITRGVAVA
jgi:hypothetical protein